MLGQLLQNINTATRRSTTPRNTQLDSFTEEAHTINLLFPDAPNPLDNDGPGGLDLYADGATYVRSLSISDHGHDKLDLECPRDIRVLIAQDHDLMHHRLLFDSKPALPPESPRIGAGGGGHSRSSSRNEPGPSQNVLGGTRPNRPPTIPENAGHKRTPSTQSTGSGVFQRGGKRKGSISSITSLDDGWQGGTSLRDTEDIQKIAVGCMFENAKSTYKGPSNKVHVVPVASKPYDNSICNPSLTIGDLGVQNLSLGRTTMVRRPSSLSKTHIAGDPLGDSESVFARPTYKGSRRFVLVTRTFSVPWVEDDFKLEMQRNGVSMNGRPSVAGKAVPVNPSDARIDSRIMTSYRRPWKSLMYAVTIVISLPIEPDEMSPPVSRTGTFGRKSAKELASRQNSIVYGSSAESEKRFPYIPDNLADSIAMTSDVDDKVDLIGQHWDIFARALTTLQYIAQKKIYEMLKVLSRQTRPVFKLPPMALGSDETIMKSAEDACVRVIRGMKIDRVRSGHGRWPAWREEARWMNRWAGSQDKNFFFITLVSAFLGTHTEWLRTSAPKWYRKRYREQQRSSHSVESVLIPSRTVIVSKDKMAARRLVFLLAAFLPPSHMNRGDLSPIRPGTAASWRAISQSPPKLSGIVRQESLRRTIHRPSKRGNSLTRYSTKSRTSSVVATGDAQDDRPEPTIRFDSGDSHPRRGSETRPTRSKLYMTEGDPTIQKAETTTATVAAGPGFVRPHFARQPSFGQSAPSVHSRQSSTASASLVPLQRTTSSGTESQWSGRWGSLKNLWNLTSRRNSTTSENSDILLSTDEGLGISDMRDPDGLSKIQQIVEDVQNVTADVHIPLARTPIPADDTDHPSVFASPELKSSSPPPDDQSSPKISRKVSKPIDVPLKMSVNEDGIIDVDIPFLGYGSPIFSSGLHPEHHHHSGSSLEGSSSLGHLSASFLTMSPREPDRPPNVAGWIEKVHPDFTLQAVKAYADVIKDVKASMSAEPNPPCSLDNADGPVVDRWLDVCTAVVADTASWTVTRLRLKRHVRFVRHSASGSMGPIAAAPAAVILSPGGGNSRSIYGNPYSQPALNTQSSSTAAAVAEFVIEEQFAEERVTDWEVYLAEALGRIISQLQDSPTKSQPIPGEEVVGRGREQRSDEARAQKDAGAVILGALENIVADVAKTKGTNGAEASRQHDSTLREGVKTWLEEIEAKSAATEMPRPNGAETVSTATPTAKDNAHEAAENEKHNGNAAVPSNIILEVPAATESNDGKLPDHNMDAADNNQATF
jgi:folliculin-interacting protein